MKSNKYILAITSLLISGSLLSQSKELSWAQNIGGSDREEATCITPTSDNGVIVSGYTYSKDGLLSSNKGWQDGWLVKTNQEGHIEWQNNYGGNDADVIEEVVETTDGYIICGWSSSTISDFVTSNGFEDGFIAKINFSGKLVWKKSFGGLLMDKLFDLEILDNGDIVSVGYTMSPDIHLTNSAYNGLLDVWVIRLTSNGDVVWKKAFGGSDDDFAYNILKTPNNKLIIAGSSDSMDGQVGATVGEWDCWLFEIDLNGELEWTQKFGYEANEVVNDLIFYNNNYYIIGSSNSSNRSSTYGNYDAWIVQIDQSGNFIEDYSFGSSEKDLVRSATATPDGIFISGESEGDHSRDGWLIQIDGNGSVMQSLFVGGSDYDLLNDIAYKDNAVYVSGLSYSSDGDVEQNFGESDALIAKFGGEIQENNHEIKVFPNPASDQMTIVLDKIGIEQIAIYNSLGQVVQSMNANDFFQEQIDVSSWDSGVYTVEALSDGELIRSQFIKL